MVSKGSKANAMVTLHITYFSMFGVCKVFRSDGGSQFVFGTFWEFLPNWLVKQRISSAYDSHGNTTAEPGIKLMKILIQNNLGPGENLDTEAFATAVMEYCNTPDKDTLNQFRVKLDGWGCVSLKNIRFFLEGSHSMSTKSLDW